MYVVYLLCTTAPFEPWPFLLQNSTNYYSDTRWDSLDDEISARFLTMKNIKKIRRVAYTLRVDLRSVTPVFKGPTIFSQHSYLNRQIK
jgi:hypothetical protein